MLPNKLAAAVLILFVFHVKLTSASRKQSPVDLTLNDLNGHRVHLRDYRGKVVVLNFWATWCAPCNEEMPMLAAAGKKWAAKNIVFLGVSLDDKSSQTKIPEFVRKFDIHFPILTGNGADDLARLHLGEAIPATAFLEADGSVFARIQGEMRPAELDARLDWITGKQTGSAPEPLVTHLDK